MLLLGGEGGYSLEDGLGRKLGAEGNWSGRELLVKELLPLLLLQLNGLRGVEGGEGDESDVGLALFWLLLLVSLVLDWEGDETDERLRIMRHIKKLMLLLLLLLLKGGGYRGLGGQEPDAWPLEGGVGSCGKRKSSRGAGNNDGLGCKPCDAGGKGLLLGFLDGRR